MTEFATQPDQANALAKLAGLSRELRSRLRTDPSADISDILDQREEACRGLASGPIEPDADREALAEEILECQHECEALLKERLEAAAQALRQSTQRRKLDSVYGPACSHSTPVYLDKQQ